MPIFVVCPQGHKLKAEEKLAGKQLKCPKCGSVVQIPELEAPEPDDGLVLEESTEQPDPKMEWPADGEMSSALDDDPLGLGDASAQSDSLFDDDLPPLDDPLNAQGELPATPAPQQATLQSADGAAETKRGWLSSLSMTQIAAIAGGGAVLGLLLVGLLAWLLFGGGEEEPPAVADGNAVPPADVAQAPSVDQAEQASEEAQPEPAAPKEQPTVPKPKPAVPELAAGGLREAQEVGHAVRLFMAQGPQDALARGHGGQGGSSGCYRFSSCFSSSSNPCGGCGSFGSRRLKLKVMGCRTKSLKLRHEIWRLETLMLFPGEEPGFCATSPLRLNVMGVSGFLISDELSTANSSSEKGKSGRVW